MGVLEEIVLAMNYVGVFAFAVSGVLKGIDKDMDVFGCAFLGLVTAFGGGVVRDLVAGEVPPLAFRSEVDFSVAIFAIVSALCMYRFRNFVKTLPYFDAIGLGAFAALGGEVAVKSGLGPIGIVFASMITGCGGGMIRDVLAGEIPLVLRRELYATTAIVGGIAFYFLSRVSMELALFVSAVVTTSLRMVAIRFGINLPRVRRERT